MKNGHYNGIVNHNKLKIRSLNCFLIWFIMLSPMKVFAQQLIVDDLNKKELRSHLLYELNAKDSVQRLLSEERIKNEQLLIKIEDGRELIGKLNNTLESKSDEINRLNQTLAAKNGECERKTLEINSLEQRIASLNQDLVSLQTRLENNSQTEGSVEVVDVIPDIQSPDHGDRAPASIRLGTVYKCTKTLFADNPEMVVFIRKRNPGYVDNKYSALQFDKNSNRVIGGTISGSSRLLEDPENATFVLNTGNQTITIAFPDKNAAEETYWIELNSNKNLVSALLLVGANGAIKARYNLIGQ